MVDWVRKIFLGLAGTDTAVAAEANAALSEYFVQLLDDRRSNPRDPEHDMVTYFLQARIDGEPISQEYLLSILVTLVLAGLDTTKSQLGFNFHHLATNPDDRLGWSRIPPGFRPRSKRCSVCSRSCHRHASWPPTSTTRAAR